MTERNDRKKKIHQRLPSVRPPMLLAGGAAVLLVAAAVAAVWHFVLLSPSKHSPSQDRQYSEKGIDEGSQCRFSPDTLGDYQVVASHLSEDGSYFEYLLCGEVMIRTWRSPEESGMNCKKTALQKYPELSDYRGAKPDKDIRDTFDQRGSFTAPNAQGETENHTVLWVSRGGWDYFLDFAVPQSAGASHDVFIETVIGGIYFI